MAPTFSSSFPCSWSCSAVWIGQEPTAEQLQERMEHGDLMPFAQNSEEERRYKELAKTSEYAAGKVVTLLDRYTGVVALNNKKKGQGSKDVKYGEKCLAFSGCFWIFN